MALWSSQRLFFGSPLLQLSEIAKSALFSNNMPCGNDMIDAYVENLMDSKADHRFTTITWKSLRLSHNHLDKCKAFIHITTKPIITNLICQKNKTEKEKATTKKGHFKLAKKGTFLNCLDKLNLFLDRITYIG